MFRVRQEMDASPGRAVSGRCGRGCYSCSFLASAKLPGQTGGGDVAIDEREMAVNGPVVFQASEGQDLFDVQEVAAIGKGEDLFQVVAVCGMFHSVPPCRFVVIADLCCGLVGIGVCLGVRGDCMSGQREFEEYARELAEASRKQQQAQEVAEKKAEEKRVKRADLLFEIFKALAVAGVTLLVEHIGDIWAFLHK